MRVQETRVQTDRVLTVPNALSVLRLLAIPLFLWLLLGPRRYDLAGWVLGLSAATDWLDGWWARHFNVISRVGQLLDPLVDRLFVLSTVLGVAVAGVVPWWLVGLLVARDLVLALLLPSMQRRFGGPLPVHFMGKAATFNLLLAFPFVLWGVGPGAGSSIWHAMGWAFLGWGTFLYWWSALLYVGQARSLPIASAAAARPGAVAGG